MADGVDEDEARAGRMGGWEAEVRAVEGG